MKLKLILLFLFTSLGFQAIYAQSGVAISESADQRADASAILDVVSTSKGMLVPRMTNSQRNSISSPATGLLIYQTNNTPGFYYYDGSAWQAISGSSSGGSESDPEVSSSIINGVPAWNGSTLIDGSMEDDGSQVSVYTDGGLEKVRLSNFTDGEGYVFTFGPSGSQNVALSSLSGNPNNGFITISDSDGQTKVGAYVTADNTGSVYVNGPNGNQNGAFTFLSGNPNNGYVGVNDSDGQYQAAIYVDGSGVGQLFTSGAKSFRVPHPTDSSKEIWYAALEGPEAAMYIRGTGTLVNGAARIELPEHFSVLADEKSMTVLTSPLSADSKGLAITEKNNANFVVKELMNGTGNYSFDWEVKCVRQSLKDFNPVRPKVEVGERNRESNQPNGSSIKANKKQ